ncbi:hypothetical protein AB0V79_08345 [Mesorhizobium ciceri]|uniref:hypothetical protein n=1 Tax=Mesorhizobium TaxID=68287 RepID=UPI000A708FBB|nr:MULTISPECIES: hypothetical protein [Mesorhizobium]
MSVKTHREVKNPRLSDNKLADYMNASEQARRSILRSCKYQPKAAVIQHHDAKKMVAESMVNGKINHDMLTQKLGLYGGKITDTDFEAEVKQHNIDYVNCVLTMGCQPIKGTDFDRCKISKKLDFNGTEISFFPDLLVARTNQKNNRKIGAINFRYSKSAKLPEKTAGYQSALMFGVFRDEPFEPEAMAERDLCQTLDCFNGKVYVAPTNAVYLYNEMKAACGAIAYQWPNIEPPTGAIF